MRVADLRTQIFCDEHSGLSPEAEQHVCLAIDALSMARHHLRLAEYRQMKKE
jgi:hypothetical protein